MRGGHIHVRGSGSIDHPQQQGSRKGGRGGRQGPGRVLERAPSASRPSTRRGGPPHGPLLVCGCQPGGPRVDSRPVGGVGRSERDLFTEPDHVGEEGLPTRGGQIHVRGSGFIDHPQQHTRERVDQRLSEGSRRKGKGGNGSHGKGGGGEREPWVGMGAREPRAHQRAEGRRPRPSLLTWRGGSPLHPPSTRC